MFWKRKKTDNTDVDIVQTNSNSEYVDQITKLEKSYGQPAFLEFAANLNPDQRAEFLITLSKNIPFIRHKKKMDYQQMTIGHEMFGKVIRRKSNFKPEQIAEIFETLSKTKVPTNHWQAQSKTRPLHFYNWHVGHLVNQLEKSLKTHELNDQTRKRLIDISKLKQFNPDYNSSWGSNVGKARQKLIKLITPEDGSGITPFIFTDDSIGTAIKLSISSMEESDANKWHSLFHDAVTATCPAPFLCASLM